MSTDVLSSGPGLAGPAQHSEGSFGPPSYCSCSCPPGLCGTGPSSPPQDRQPLGRLFHLPGVLSACRRLTPPCRWRHRTDRAGTFSVSRLATWVSVLKSTPHLILTLLPLKCPHGAGSEPRLPVRVRRGWNSPTFPTQNICAHSMTLPEGRSRCDFGLNTLVPAGTLMQSVCGRAVTGTG